VRNTIDLFTHKSSFDVLKRRKDMKEKERNWGKRKNWKKPASKVRAMQKAKKKDKERKKLRSGIRQRKLAEKIRDVEGE